MRDAGWQSTKRVPNSGLLYDLLNSRTHATKGEIYFPVDSTDLSKIIEPNIVVPWKAENVSYELNAGAGGDTVGVQ